MLFTAALLVSCLKQAPVPMNLRVHISVTGACSVKGHDEVPCESLGALLKEMNAQSWCEIHIEVDKESQYRFLEAALASLRKEGFENVGFLNEKP